MTIHQVNHLLMIDTVDEDGADLQKDHVIDDQIVIEDRDDHGHDQNHEDIDRDLGKEISQKRRKAKKIKNGKNAVCLL